MDDKLTDLERAQMILQLFMLRYKCDEEKAKEIINNSTWFAGRFEILHAIKMMTPPAFTKGEL